MIQDESKKRVKSITKVITVALVMFFVSPVQAKTVRGEISRVGDATHLEFKGLDQWNYDLSKSGDNKITLQIPAFDKKTEVALQTWSGQFIDGVEVNKTGTDGRYKVTFTLSDSTVENFDYLTDEPSRLIIDFFKQVEPVSKSLNASANEKNTRSKKKKVAKKGRVTKSKLKKGEYTKYEREGGDSNRKPAGELDPKYESFQAETSIDGEFPMRGAFDGGDPNFDRFRMKDYEIDERSIIASRQNFYIRFPMLKMPTSQLSLFLENRPEYVIKEKPTKENKEARLLLQLYKKKRVGLFLKTYRYFKDKYPDSNYGEIIDHLAAEVHFDRYLESNDLTAYQQAQAIYRSLLKAYPDSPLAERTELILGFAELERGNGIETIQLFQAFLDKYKDSEFQDHAKKSIAAGFLILNKYKDAYEAYKKLSKTAQKRSQGVESFYRIGDVFFQERNYKKAIKAYEEALESHPKYESQFPNAHYNIAESHFWLGNYQKALNHYVEFLSRFPSHSHGGYAMTRIGENMDILGADKIDVMGAYLESYFRYRENPGAKIARIRMLSQRMKGMKDKEMKKALEEITNIADSSELPRIKEFVTLMKADGFDKREEFQKAMNLLISYYQKNPTSTDLQFFKKKILNGIAEVLHQKVGGENYIEALKFNGKYAKTWLRNSDRLDIPYFVGRAYEQAGVFKEAQTIYKKTLKDLGAIAGTAEDKERRVTEKIPTLDEVRLRIARNYMELRKYAEAQSVIKDIDPKELRTLPKKIELVQIQADVSERRGLIEQAKRNLSKLEESWKEQPELLAPVLLRLSRLQVKSKEYVDAIQTIEKIEEIRKNKGSLGSDLWADTLQLKGETLEKQGKSLAAVETYISLLKEYEAKRPLASVRYRAGKLLFNRGDVQGAQKIWEPLNSEKDPMFRRLADERLRDAKWQNDYKKYINRIPAMTDKK